MTTLTRNEFVARNQQRSLDVNQATRGMDARAAAQVRAADVDGDGQIRGTRELQKAFTALDSLDRDGNPNSIKTTGFLGMATPAGKATKALERASPAPRRGLGGGRTEAADAPRGAAQGDVAGVARGTGYYPHNSKMEGGYNDMRGKKLHTLQDFLAGRAPHVSIALDKNLYKNGAVKYGDTFRIPELEAKYGREIVFKAVDTGGAFTNKGFSRVDICTGSRRDSLDPTVNGRLTLVRQ